MKKLSKTPEKRKLWKINQQENAMVSVTMEDV